MFRIGMVLMVAVMFRVCAMLVLVLAGSSHRCVRRHALSRVR